MKLVYVAGPFSGDVERNVKEAVELGLAVAKLGACPIIPHSMTSDPRFQETQDYEFWIEGTLELMLRCDVVILTPRWKESKGARNEVVVADSYGRPIFSDLSLLEKWLKRHDSQNTNA